MVLTIGINRSGSSLLGYLLTAHPNIVIADEIQHPIETNKIWEDGGINYLKEQYNGAFNYLFSKILDVDRLRYQYGKKISTSSLHTKMQQKNVIKRNFKRNERYVLVPNQYQGRFERLKVIGVKASHENTLALLKNNTLVNLRRRLKKRDIKLKFLFTVRNPYDLTARMLIANSFTAEKTARTFPNHCKQPEDLLKRIDSQDVFVNRHEDMCRDPRRQLSRLCDFLEVPIPDGYTEDCASRVVQEQHKSRLDIDWSPQLKQTVARAIEKYDFLSGYDWET